MLLPLQPHFLALHGLSKLLHTVQLVSDRLNPDLELTGVVLCMFDAGTRLANEVAKDVSEFFTEHQQSRGPWARADLFSTRIRRNIRLAEAPSFGQSIFQYAPDSNGAEDYRRLSGELVARMARPRQPVASAAGCHSGPSGTVLRLSHGLYFSSGDTLLLTRGSMNTVMTCHNRMRKETKTFRVHWRTPCGFPVLHL